MSLPLALIDRYVICECGISRLSQTLWRGFVCLQFVKVAFQDIARRGDTGLSTVCECGISRLSQKR